MRSHTRLGLASVSLLIALYACAKKDEKQPGTLPGVSSATSGVTSSAGKGGSAGMGMGGKGGSGGAGGLGGATSSSAGGTGGTGSGGTSGVGGTGGIGVGGAGGSMPNTLKAAWADYSQDKNAIEGATALASDTTGNVFVAGTFTGLITLAGKSHGPAMGKQDIYLGKLDPTGKHVWSTQWVSSGSPSITAMAADFGGNLYVIGQYDASLKIGANQLPAANNNFTMFAALLEPNGNVKWAKAIGGGGEHRPTAVATDKAGGIVATGYFKGTMDFGKQGGLGDPVTVAAVNDYDIFLVKLDDKGNPFIAQRYGDLGPQLSWSVATGNNNEVALAGSFSGDIDFGGGKQSTQDKGNAFVAVLTPDLQMMPTFKHKWTKVLGGADFQEARSLVFDSKNDLLVSGYFAASMLLDKVLKSAGDDDIFVAKMAANDGMFLWSAAFGDAQQQRAYGLLVTAQDESVVVGYANGTTAVASDMLVSKGSSDAVVLKLDSSGKALWGASFGGGGVDEAKAIARGMNNQMLVAGNFNSEIDLGVGKWTTMQPDLFVAAFPPNP
jgi:hypothetical protein